VVREERVDTGRVEEQSGRVPCFVCIGGLAGSGTVVGGTPDLVLGTALETMVCGLARAVVGTGGAVEGRVG